LLMQDGLTIWFQNALKPVKVKQLSYNMLAKTNDQILVNKVFYALKSMALVTRDQN